MSVSCTFSLKFDTAKVGLVSWPIHAFFPSDFYTQGDVIVGRWLLWWSDMRLLLAPSSAAVTPQCIDIRLHYRCTVPKFELIHTIFGDLAAGCFISRLKSSVHWWALIQGTDGQVHHRSKYTVKLATFKTIAMERLELRMRICSVVIACVVCRNTGLWPRLHWPSGCNGLSLMWCT